MPTISTYDSNGQYADELVSDGVFSEIDITKAIASLTGYDRYDTIAHVETGDAMSPAALKAFSALAEALHGDIEVSYGRLNVRKQRSAEELRKRAIEQLKG